MQKYLAKGRDLDEAALNLEYARDLRSNLKQNLNQYSDQLETIRERIEGAMNLMERYRNFEKTVDSDGGGSGKMMGKTSTPSNEADRCSCWQSDARDEDEDHSKMADSGLGGCDRCDMNDKLVRTCSCQSFDEPTTKSHNSDELEEDCFDNNMKNAIDYQMSPLKPNAHLYSYSSNIALPDLENTCGLAPKTQK